MQQRVLTAASTERLCLTSAPGWTLPAVSCLPSGARQSSAISAKLRPDVGVQLVEPASGEEKKLVAVVANSIDAVVLTKSELHVVDELKNGLLACSAAFAGVGVAQVGFTLVEASRAHEEGHGAGQGFEALLGLSVGDVAYWVDALALGALLLYAAKPFERALNGPENTPHLRNVFEGLGRISLIMQQIFIGSLAISTVCLLEAASIYPPIVKGASAMFFALAVLRSAAMWYVLGTHTTDSEHVHRTLCNIRSNTTSMSLVDKLAVQLAFGYMLKYEKPIHPDGPHQPHMDSEGKVVYEFTPSDERLLMDLTQSANTAGLALALQAFATFILVASEFGAGEASGVVSNGINLVNKTLMSALLFSTTSSFDRIIHEDGNDMDHLVTGMSEEGGLTQLFERMTVLNWSLVLAGLMGVAAPGIVEKVEESPLLAGVADVTIHRVADVIVEGMTMLSKL